MAFNKLPSSFFGAGYTTGTGTITLKTASNAAGSSLGTFTVAFATDPEILTLTDHGLAVGDRVRFSGDALPSGLSAATDYWVVSVPSTSTFKVSLVRGGAEINMTSDGTGTASLMGFLDDVGDELTGSEPTADWRKVVAGLMEALNQQWVRMPAADRPSKLIISKSIGTANGSNVVTYAVRVSYAPQSVVDVAAE